MQQLWQIFFLKTYTILGSRSNILIHITCEITEHNFKLVYDTFQNLNAGHFNSRERDLSIHWIGGWVGPRVGLDTGENSQMLPGIEMWFPSSGSGLKWCKNKNNITLTIWNIITSVLFCYLLLKASERHLCLNNSLYSYKQFLIQPSFPDCIHTVMNMIFSKGTR
jgi:antibiotic biosynthesis monooxygenase (ABM) superfamily enzyme